MAAVIAHEIKNPLAGIRGAIPVFGGRMVQAGANTQILNEIVSRIDALDQMMKDLLLFAPPPKPEHAPIDLVPLVRTTACRRVRCERYLHRTCQSRAILEFSPRVTEKFPPANGVACFSSGRRGRDTGNADCSC
jgi:C4-dicarboxylate-specific signal transduction histidine kinase